MRRRGLDITSGQWWEFKDSEGLGHAQTDHFLVGRHGVLLMEVKLTQTPSAFLQMSQLYVPILQHHYQLPIYTLQVCKNLRYKPEAEEDLVGLLSNPRPGNFTWHLPN